ncbi:MAG: biotin--[acetyl-CoA-carboxylase] ligase [Deltaproteobacteria bacterium]|jgi:BirA family biotin operon repressor/biotin-[acetyl-CoA-carboxylase] ligase|nr:biotin--[acetyl-CoA-carboxylase] ligase [Deltaproteobacteria bacterium]
MTDPDTFGVASEPLSGEPGPGPRIFLAGTVSSVLDLSWELLAKDPRFGEFSSLVAESQTAGRGRRGRTWASPPGHLYAALLLPEKPPFEGQLASVSVSLFLVLALEEILGPKPMIKWPNDLMLDGWKFGGVLLENRGGKVMAGIGMNLNRSPETERHPRAPETGALPAGDLSPLDLWKRLASNVFSRYNDEFGKKGSSPRDSSPHRGERVASMTGARLHGMGKTWEVLDPRCDPPAEGNPLRGVLRGIDPRGNLLLETDGLVRRVWSGTLLTLP